MSASGEPPAEEDPGVADPDNNDDDDVPNNSDADTEPAMLEEEEMPTYMSITSSSRLDESRADMETLPHPEIAAARGDRPKTPYANNDQAGDCVYVVSSGDESDRRHVDDDDMEDYDSDEMDLDEEEEEEDDEDDSRPDLNDEEDSEADIEQFERSSDDFVLRYDSGLEKHHKTRSRSLQDLTNSRSNLSRFVGKRRSIDLVDNYGPEIPMPNPECLRDPLGDLKKTTRSRRYDGVPSKVKLYIQSIKEQSRRSMERKHRDGPANRNFHDAEAVTAAGGNVDVPCPRLNPANRLIKGYVQHAMKQISAEIPEEAETGGATIDRDNRLQAEIVPQIQTVVPNNLTKFEKSNGLIDYSMHNHVDKIVEPMETCTPNGQEEMAAILNLRTLSYEEYTNGDETAANKTEVVETPCPIVEDKNGIAERTEEGVVGSMEIEKVSVPTVLRTDVAKTGNIVPDEAQGVRESSDSAKAASHDIEAAKRDGNEIVMLWSMLNEKTAKLNEKTAQYDGIRDAFQKTLAENISLKREMDELRKTLAKNKKDNEPRATKVASVQTDSIAQIEEPKIPTSETKPPMPKLLSTSVGSALSSIEQWSDSNCSAAISINPPNMDNVLNSDDSLNGAGATPRKSSRQLSQSFVTSSRILQTLANITQGRTKSTRTLGKNIDSRLGAEQGQSKQQSNSPLARGNEAAAARSKKRKASDMTSPADYGQSFKIPYMPGEPRRKVNSDFETDAVLKSAREQSRISGHSEPAAGGSKVDESSERLPDDLEDTGGTDVPDNVKCFVYHEDTDSEERSFLIQAEEPSKNSQVGDKGGTVRECGPYLLGNVEIRMTEANGTINIWGKEVSQCSEELYVNEDTEESEPHEKPSTSRMASPDCQRTPRMKFPNGSPFSCSTNKKSKGNSHFGRSGIGKYFRPAFSNMSRTNDLAKEGQQGHYRSSPNLNDETSGCEHCEWHKKPQRFNWPSCQHLANSRRKQQQQQQQHSCCIHSVEVNKRDRDCSRDRDCGAIDDDDDEPMYESVSNILNNHNKCGASCPNVSSKYPSNDGTRRHQTSHNRHSPDIEMECHHAKKRRSSCTGDIPSCNPRLTSANLPSRNNRSCSRSHHNSCDDEDYPLLSNGQHCETPETKRRRLSGKRVRGILTDLLRNCGGCRDPNSTSFVAKEPSSLPNSIPSVRIIPCTPPYSSCSEPSATCASHPKQPPRDVPNDNGCSACARRFEMAAEIESKLEILTVEMERLRSRSSTLHGMLDLLHSETD